MANLRKWAVYSPNYRLLGHVLAERKGFAQATAERLYGCGVWVGRAA